MASAQRLSSVSNLHAEAELAIAAASCVPGSALQAGRQAPLFSLADGKGRLIALESMLERGPVVLSFCRGTWCAFGARGFDAFCSFAPELTALGASAVSIIPVAAPSAPLAGADSVTVLHDADMGVARRYGLAFDLPISLRPHYQALGYRPPEPDRIDSWLVPVPAVYVLDRAGVVVLACVERDYRKRFDAAPVIGALKAISPTTNKQRKNNLTPQF